MQLYTDDLVASRRARSYKAVVERTHADVETHEPYPQQGEDEKIKKHPSVSQADFSAFIRDGIPRPGQVFVRWYRRVRAELLPESELLLIDRTLLIGDIVKRNARDAMSGVVITATTKCKLQSTCELKYAKGGTFRGFAPVVKDADAPVIVSGLLPDTLTDIPAAELKHAQSPTEIDLVVYKDWIGRVNAIVDKLSIRLLDNSVVEIDDDLAEPIDFSVDQCSVGDVVETKKCHLRNGRWIFGQYSPNTPPVGTVVEVRPVSMNVLWLQNRLGSRDEREPPATLEREELDSSHLHIYDKTRRPGRSSTAAVTELGATLSFSDIDVSLGQTVRFKDLAGACVKYDGSTASGKLNRIDRKDTLGYDMNVYAIKSFCTDVTVQWQDLTITVHSSTELIPDAISIDDEHAVWPGEIATNLANKTSGDQWIREPEKIGVVQSVTAEDRMAQVRWCADASVQYVKGGEEPEVLMTFVVGTAGGESEELTLYDIEAPAALNVRRGDFVQLTQPQSASTEIDWFGEIVDTCLDGTLTVRLGAASQVRDVHLRREQAVLVIRSDGTDEMDDEFVDDAPADAWANLQTEATLNGITGPWHREGEEDLEDYGDEENDEIEEEEAEPYYEDENGNVMDEEEVENEDWESEEGEETTSRNANVDSEGAIDTVMLDALTDTPPTSHPGTLPGSSVSSRRRPDNTEPEPRSFLSYDNAPEPYEILDTPLPANHRYISSQPTASPNHLKRLQKEHKILRTPSALPEGVYVRTWESRLDLLRVLFVGPTGTPYDSASFLFDFHLSADFPNAPPEAYFHSWVGESSLGGVGRVNPNLYEDGKVCLSLLGTWKGDKGEGWNASQSTLLQVLVSLLGLVLVREPFFNEAGYEPLAGLESSRLPSALYSERTYLRSRAFIVHALTGWEEIDPFVNVVNWLYRDTGGPKLLEQSIAQLDQVLRRSEGEQTATERDGLNVVTKGACVPLRRLLGVLGGLHNP